MHEVERSGRLGDGTFWGAVLLLSCCRYFSVELEVTKAGPDRFRRVTFQTGASALQSARARWGALKRHHLSHSMA